MATGEQHNHSLTTAAKDRRFLCHLSCKEAIRVKEWSLVEVEGRKDLWKIGSGLEVEAHYLLSMRLHCTHKPAYTQSRIIKLNFKLVKLGNLSQNQNRGNRFIKEWAAYNLSDPQLTAKEIDRRSWVQVSAGQKKHTYLWIWYHTAWQNHLHIQIPCERCAFDKPPGIRYKKIYIHHEQPFQVPNHPRQYRSISKCSYA